VYCRDLTKLIVHVRSRVLATIPAKTRRKLGMQPLSHESVIAAQLMVNRRKISSAANSWGVEQLSSSSGQLRVPAPE
jgi:bifunctional DNA-binding transcriptional regulator/antitoxin component of YhaV-PrlF toxin-antitoxin module